MRYLNVNLAAFVGEPVIIRYDPRDLGQIRVFHDGTVSGTAEPEAGEEGHGLAKGKSFDRQMRPAVSMSA